MDLLANEIAEKIRNKIECQEYKQGDHLTVRSLCEEFGTSETPVKQAMNQLVATGLLVTVPKCGIKVRTFTFEDMKNVLEARLMIEQFCSKDAIREAKENPVFTKKISECLENCNETITACIKDFTRERYYETIPQDRMLHEMIVRCSNNAQIIRMYENLNSHAGMFLGYDVHSPEVMEDVKKEHMDIVLSLLRFDRHDLNEAIARHVQSTIELYKKANYTAE